ncbi:MAG: hypothetical protein WAV20_18510, partial [Blastocatellia bacterium]
MKYPARLFLTSLVLLLSMGIAGAAQDPKKKGEKDWVINLKTVLVELQAVVTDQQGRLVDGLKKEDFELREKGRLQDISSFAAQRIGGISISQPVTVASVPNQDELTTPPIESTRSVLLLVDTLHMSGSNVLRVKQTIK